MSELSPVYSEYERISSLLRRLNEGILLAQQIRLGLLAPSKDEESEIRRNLETALQELADQRLTSTHLTFADIAAQLRQEDCQVTDQTLSAIRNRMATGLGTLTSDDLAVIERVSDVLDAKSELLFRRIQK